MISIREYVNIKDYCTLKVGGQFRYFINVASVSELKEAQDFAKEKSLPVRILGAGSNTVFPDGVLENVALKVDIKGMEKTNETDSYADIKVGAGEVWDDFVRQTVSMNLSGIEALSAIPGTVGATPVQNVGAYGQEVGETITSIEAYDLENGKLQTLSNDDCRFSYRDSAFKNELKGKYMILYVTFRLSKNRNNVPDYPGVSKYFDENNIQNPTIAEVREAIINIRQTKLPDPDQVPNVGSFFKNPIISKNMADKIKTDNPNLAVFPVDESHVKIPAGFLIENVGLKGYDFGHVSTYVNNALVLVNNGNATRQDIENVKNEIAKRVFDKFNINLEPEPEFV